MDLNNLTTQVEQLLKEKGFWSVIETKNVYQLSALLHTEVSEYTQLYKRHGLDEAHKEERADEIADIIIRTLNLAVLEGIDVAEVVKRKMESNFNRPYRYNTVGEKNE